jgi:hypothetical protein
MNSADEPSRQVLIFNIKPLSFFYSVLGDPLDFLSGISGRYVSQLAQSIRLCPPAGGLRRLRSALLRQKS